MGQELDQLKTKLTEEFRRDSRGRAAAKMLAEYAQSYSDWRKLVFFDPERYTRNLLHRTADYELLLLCWEAGQASPIHDHAGQDCWMAVLEGELEEQHYLAPRAGPPSALVLGRRAAVRPGGVAYIEDGIALHRIRPLQDQRGVSLHLYSKPIDTCRIYNEATGEARSVELGYYSVLGQRSAEDAATIRKAWSAGALR